MSSSRSLLCPSHLALDADHVANADDALRRPIGPQVPICCPFLHDEHEAAALEELSAWVGWLAERFELDHRMVPTCWREHGPIIEELSALYTAWQSAYLDDADAPLRWMAAFAAARDRLTVWALRTGCRADQHRTRDSTG